MHKIHISVVTPVYGCGACLPLLYERLKVTLESISSEFEIIMVNDASPDNSWEVIKTLAKNDNRVKGIKFSRNFGQHRAITAGIDYAKGRWVVVMDCDLQDQPEEILKLYNKAQEGYDIVFGRRASRQDSYMKKMSSTIFYKIYDYFTESKIDNTVANFSIISYRVVEKLRMLREHSRSYPLLINLVGFSRADVDIEHARRLEGKSAYTFKKLFELAIDSIVSQSNRPLRLSIQIGFSVTAISFAYGIWLMLRYFIYSTPIEGWTSVMVSIYFVGGLIFANFGVLGLYVGKIFDETKNRPLYLLEEVTFDEDSE